MNLKEFEHFKHFKKKNQVFLKTIDILVKM